MIILPAIDLMGGEVVRLQQGKADQKTVYSTDPAAKALEWQELGGEYLHIVDLDGAFTGSPKNLDSVRAITSAISIPCELGGGMRTLDDVAAALEAGVDRIVIGSKACESPDFIREAASRFGGEHIAVGIDAKDGIAAVNGWTEQSTWSAIDLAKKVEELGASTLIYTDIATDGMLQGPNLAAMREMKEAVGMNIIASGGVSSLEDIRNLIQIEGLYGAIVGKALYDQKFTLPECLSNTR